MSLPGFSAENSLYRANTNNCPIEEREAPSGAVLPAQLNYTGRLIKGRKIKTIPLKCAPLTICQPDPLEPFCEVCTQLDANCVPSTYQQCIGVKIPKKIPVKIPDPVLRLARRLG